MKTNILAIANGLSDQDLLARLDVLAGRERGACVELVAHLAALDARPALYAAEGYGSLFSYCIQALRLSEDAACNRIEAARASRRFPVILELLASGDVTLTSVRLLSRHLTAENHQAVLAKASGRSRRQIEELVAELAPRPDVPSLVRRLPTLTAMPQGLGRAGPNGDQTVHADRSERQFARFVRSDAPADRPGHGSRALSGAVHHRPRDPREASARSGTPPPRDPGW